jgi:hypothetical protein
MNTKMNDEAPKPAPFKGHGISVRPKEGGLSYAPGRDFAEMYPAMLKSMTMCFERHDFPKILEHVMAIDGCDIDTAFDIVCEANDVYWEFALLCTDSPTETVCECLTRAGWDDVSEGAKAGWLEMMGQIMTGQLCMGLRDIVPANGSPADYVDSIRWYVDEGRRHQNGIDSKTELKRKLQEAVRGLAKCEVHSQLMKDWVDEARTGSN